jgi:hypothetical protein
MFAHPTRMFEVVDDRPPYPSVWADPVRDPWDVPIFVAARNAATQFVVTMNLQDGPRPDPAFAGLRVWARVVYVSPDQFLDFVSWTLDEVAGILADPDAGLATPWWLVPEDPTDQPQDRQWKQIRRLLQRHAE